MEDHQHPIFLSVPQTATLLGRGLSSTWRMVYGGELPSVKIGRSRRIPRQAVVDYAERLIEQARKEMT